MSILLKTIARTVAAAASIAALTPLVFLPAANAQQPELTVVTTNENTNYCSYKYGRLHVDEHNQYVVCTDKQSRWYFNQTNTRHNLEGKETPALNPFPDTVHGNTEQAVSVDNLTEAGKYMRRNASQYEREHLDRVGNMVSTYSRTGIFQKNDLPQLDIPAGWFDTSKQAPDAYTCPLTVAASGGIECTSQFSNLYGGFNPKNTGLTFTDHTGGDLKPVELTRAMINTVSDSEFPLGVFDVMLLEPVSGQAHAGETISPIIPVPLPTTQWAPHGNPMPDQQATPTTPMRQTLMGTLHAKDTLLSDAERYPNKNLTAPVLNKQGKPSHTMLSDITPDFTYIVDPSKRFTSRFNYPAIGTQYAENDAANPLMYERQNLKPDKLPLHGLAPFSEQKASGFSLLDRTYFHAGTVSLSMIPQNKHLLSEGEQAPMSNGDKLVATRNPYMRIYKNDRTVSTKYLGEPLIMADKINSEYVKTLKVRVTPAMVKKIVEDYVKTGHEIPRNAQIVVKAHRLPLQQSVFTSTHIMQPLVASQHWKDVDTDPNSLQATPSLFKHLFASSTKLNPLSNHFVSVERDVEGASLTLGATDQRSRIEGRLISNSLSHVDINREFPINNLFAHDYDVIPVYDEFIPENSYHVYTADQLGVKTVNNTAVNEALAKTCGVSALPVIGNITCENGKLMVDGKPVDGVLNEASTYSGILNGDTVNMRGDPLPLKIIADEKTLQANIDKARNQFAQAKQNVASAGSDEDTKQAQTQLADASKQLEQAYNQLSQTMIAKAIKERTVANVSSFQLYYIPQGKSLDEIHTLDFGQPLSRIVYVQTGDQQRDGKQVLADLKTAYEQSHPVKPLNEYTGGYWAIGSFGTLSSKLADGSYARQVPNIQLRFAPNDTNREHPLNKPSSIPLNTLANTPISEATSGQPPVFAASYAYLMENPLELSRLPETGGKASRIALPISITLLTVGLLVSYLAARKPKHASSTR